MESALTLEEILKVSGKFTQLSFFSQNRGNSCNSKSSNPASKKNLKKYLSKPDSNPIKMTERSIVISENQQFMIETDEDLQNTSMNLVLNDFKKMFEEKKKSRKKDIYSTSSQISNHSRIAANQQMSSIERARDDKTIRCNYQTQDGESSEKLNAPRQNYTARDNLDLNCDNLNEIFQEFQQEKYGPITSGKRTVQNKDLENHLENTRPNIPIPHLVNLKNDKNSQKNMNSSQQNHISQKEKERRIFKMIKKRQSLMNDNAIFCESTNQSASVDMKHHLDIEAFRNVAKQNLTKENTQELQNLKTSTFGYAVNHTQKRSEVTQSVEVDPLSNENGMMSTVTSKLNKRYISNHLVDSDSSMGDNIMDGKLTLVTS